MDLVNLGWAQAHLTAFAATKQALLDMIPLLHPKPSSQISLVTDASDTHWCAIVTQIDEDQLALPFCRPKNTSFLRVIVDLSNAAA